MGIEIKHKTTGITLKKVDAFSLYGADLREADLRGADLYGANLRGAVLYGADLSEADLREADLSGADLYGANLYGADLYEADLYGADLREADLREADLREADLRGADLQYCKGILSFIGGKHLLVYFKHKETYFFKIGYITKTKEEWLRGFGEIGTENKYGNSTDLYGDVIKLFSKYELYE